MISKIMFNKARSMILLKTSLMNKWKRNCKISLRQLYISIAMPFLNIGLKCFVSLYGVTLFSKWHLMRMLIYKIFNIL